MCGCGIFTKKYLEVFQSAFGVFVLTETSAESMFNKKYFLSRVTEEGRITLLGNTLIIVKGKEKTKEQLEEHEINEISRRDFRLTI